MESTYSIYVVPDATTDGGTCYLAYHPELQGCMSHGETVAEAIHGLHAARELYIETLRELGQPIPPEPTTPVTATWTAQPVTPISIKAALSADRLPRAELTPVS